MNAFAINGARKPPRSGSLTVISGVLLSAAGTVGPALSADLPYDTPPYRPSYYRDYSYSSGYENGCYRCSCCGRRLVRVAEPPPVVEERIVERPVVEQVPVAERHWVQRDYIERRYPYYAPPRYEYYPYAKRYRYSYYYPGPTAEAYPPYERAPLGEPRRRLTHFDYPPVPAAYDHESEPHIPYRYVASSSHPHDYYRPSYEYDYYKPTYEYEPSPRPPAGVPDVYYGHGYSE